MEARVEVHDGVGILQLLGVELDAGNAGLLQKQIAPLIADLKYLILDFSRVMFVDSTGIAMVLAQSKKLQSKDGKLVIAGASIEMCRIFELTGISKKLALVDSVPEAIELIKTISKCANTTAGCR